MTPAFQLREVEDSDHAFLVDLHNDASVLINMTDPRPITLESHMRWWGNLNRATDPKFIFLVDGVRAGFCKFYNIDLQNNSCVLGADLHRDFRGKKLSYKMWQFMLDHAFSTLKLHRVSLTTADYNTRARRVYEKLGFREEGMMKESLLRNERYHDQICMFMLDSDYRINRERRG